MKLPPDGRKVSRWIDEDGEPSDDLLDWFIGETQSKVDEACLYYIPGRDQIKTLLSESMKEAKQHSCRAATSGGEAFARKFIRFSAAMEHSEVRVLLTIIKRLSAQAVAERNGYSKSSAEISRENERLKESLARVSADRELLRVELEKLRRCPEPIPDDGTAVTVKPRHSMAVPAASKAPRETTADTAPSVHNDKGEPSELGNAPEPAESPLESLSPSATRNDVVVAALVTYPDKLAFTDRGLKSLDSARTSPSLLAEALRDLAEIAYPLYFGSGAEDVEASFTERSRLALCRGIGTQTRKNKGLMRNYSDTYEGRSIDAQPHLKKGNREHSPNYIRLYFGVDRESRKLIVSHVGNHLPCTMTRRIS